MLQLQIYKKACFGLVVLYILLFSSLSWAVEKVTFVERPDDQFLILGLEINGFSRSEGIDAYMPPSASPEDILIPLGIFAEAVSVAIQTDPTQGKAEGFFLSEDRIFELDLLRKQVISADQRLKLPEGTAEAHEDDIYVKIGALGEWFNLNTDMQTSTLTLYVTSDDTFPFEASRVRKERAEKLLTKSRKDDFDQKEAYLIPYGQIAPPSIVFQQAFTGSKTDDEIAVQSFSSLEAGFDLLGFGANLNLSYSADDEGLAEISNAGLTLSKSDPKKELLGKLKAGRIDIGDVSFSDVALFGGGARGAGIAVSSEADFGFNLSQQLGTITVDGDAPIGWDAEIYRNGQFIDFQTIEADARFNFTDVTLVSGFNRFQIILFGPEGQKRTITRDIFSGPNMLAEGVLTYDFAAGLPQSDFLPITEDPRDDTTAGASARFNYGLNNFLTIGASAFTGPVNNETSSALGLSLASSYLGVNAQLQGMVSQDSGNAIQAALSKKILGANVTLTHTSFDGFDEEDQEIKDTTDLSINRNIGPVSLSLSGGRTTFVDDQDEEIELQSIVATDILGAKLTNSLTKTLSDEPSAETFDGELSAVKEILGLRIRSGLTYDLDKDATDTFKAFRISTQKKLSETQAIRVAGNYDFATEIASVDTRYSLEVGPVTLDFDLGITNDNSYTAGINVRSSMIPIDNRYQFQPPRIGTLATLGIRAFIDENANDIFDEGEETLENMVFKATRNEQESKSNDKGVAWLYGLAETPTRIYVSEKDIDSIFIVPAQKGRDLIPRRGAKNVVDFPFIRLGEIDGFIESELDGKPLGDVPVRIVNLQSNEIVTEVKSEYDGYFIFSALPLGAYKIVASQGWFDEEEGDTKVVEVAITSKQPASFDNVIAITPFLNACEECEVFHAANPDFIGPPHLPELIQSQPQETIWGIVPKEEGGGLIVKRELPSEEHNQDESDVQQGSVADSSAEEESDTKN